MTRTDVICLRGLFERPGPGPGNMLSNLTNRLDRNRFQVEEFSPWAAGFGDYDRELDRVAGLLAEEVRRHQGPLILAGYSGGSDVIGAAVLRLAPADVAKLDRVVLCADPSMQPETQYFRPYQVYGSQRPGAYGIAMARGLPMLDKRSLTYVVDAGDPICQTPHGSPLRSLAAFLTSMGPDAGMPTRMRVKLAAAAVGRRYDLAAYGEALALFRAYAGRPSAHIEPYPALLARVGDDINRSIR